MNPRVLALAALLGGCEAQETDWTLIRMQVRGEDGEFHSEMISRPSKYWEAWETQPETCYMETDAQPQVYTWSTSVDGDCLRWSGDYVSYPADPRAEHRGCALIDPWVRACDEDDDAPCCATWRPE